MTKVSAPEPIEANHCPLCGSDRTEFFFEDSRRSFFRCALCSLVHVPACFHLSDEAERARYDLHQNSEDDEGYRNFLSQLSTPLLDRLPDQAQGLDFGCGPGPTLSGMLEERGHQVALYDKFYAPDRAVLDTTYDFVTATEVVEHLRTPAADLDLIWACVKPGGWLAIMTQFLVSQIRFKGWFYKNDLTHVGFFSPQTFEWLAVRWSAQIEIEKPGVVLMQKVAFA